MPSTTPNYNLKVYNETTDGAQTFTTFRSDIAGVAASSNMGLIDAALKDQKDDIDYLYTVKGAIPVNATYASSPSNYQALNVTGITAYESNMMIALKVNQTSNGSTTLDINNLGYKSLYKFSDLGNPTNLEVGDLVQNSINLFRYDSVSQRWYWVYTPHRDTSSQTSVTNTGNSVIQSVGLDGYGHVTSLASKDLGNRYPAEGRLALVTGTPVSASDQTSSTIYYTPYIGDMIALYDGTNWNNHTFTERSLSLSGYTANKNYDIFIYNNSGTLTLESLAWTDNSNRATALVRQNGVLCKTGALTRRYLGTIRINATIGQCESSYTKRFVWNMYNQALLPLFRSENFGHDYNSITERVWRGQSGSHLLEWVCGQSQAISANISGLTSTTGTASTTRLGPGLDSESASNRRLGVCGLAQVSGSLLAGSGGYDIVDAGYHYICPIESSAATTTPNNATFVVYYLQGSVMG